MRCKKQFPCTCYSHYSVEIQLVFQLQICVSVLTYYFMVNNIFIQIFNDKKSLSLYLLCVCIMISKYVSISCAEKTLGPPVLLMLEKRGFCVCWSSMFSKQSVFCLCFTHYCFVLLNNFLLKDALNSICR